MTTTWESPARSARLNLRETLEPRIGDRALRHEIVELAIEEFDLQFAEPDPEMISAGLAALDANLVRCDGSNYRRIHLVEEIWRAMSLRAFDR